MKAVRVIATISLVILTMVTMIKAVPAQAQAQPRVIEITATSFKFEPSVITVTQGERVVIRLRNNDTERRFNHDIASRYFAAVPLTVRAGTEGSDEGRKFVRVPAGQTAEFEFTASNPGSYAFICQVFIHSFAGMAGQLFVKRAQ
jgi:plastocyanin